MCMVMRPARKETRIKREPDVCPARARHTFFDQVRAKGALMAC